MRLHQHHHLSGCKATGHRCAFGALRSCTPRYRTPSNFFGDVISDLFVLKRLEKIEESIGKKRDCVKSCTWCRKVLVVAWPRTVVCLFRTPVTHPSAAETLLWKESESMPGSSDTSKMHHEKEDDDDRNQMCTHQGCVNDQRQRSVSRACLLARSLIQPFYF
ncbi:hypothetical protein KCV06_g72, partial [Aureobasidium melanogenum]